MPNIRNFFFKPLGLLFGLTLFTFLPVYSQPQIDHFITGLSNNDLDFEISRLGEVHTNDSGKIILQSIVLYVTSVNVDSLLLKIDKEILILKLEKALHDVNKDWYANALLYHITKKKDAFLFMGIDTREKWLRGQRKRDLEYWRKYRLNK